MLLLMPLQDAAIANGYMSGNVGSSTTSKFSQEGVGWPLETIVGVQSHEEAERERNEVQVERAMAKAAIARAKGVLDHPDRYRCCWHLRCRPP